MRHTEPPTTQYLSIQLGVVACRRMRRQHLNETREQVDRVVTRRVDARHCVDKHQRGATSHARIAVAQQLACR
jgi:hypothetical protein